MPKDKDGHLTLSCSKVSSDTLSACPYMDGGVFLNMNSPELSGFIGDDDAYVTAAFTREQALELRDYLNECLDNIKEDGNA